MRFFRGLIIILFVVGVNVLGGAAASAGTIMASGEVRIYAVVAPVHYITVDQSGIITEIDSNTADNAVPRVFKDKLTKGNEIAMTPDIYGQYRSLVPQEKSRVGVLYKRPAPSPVPQPSLIMSPVSALNIFGHLF